MNSKGYCIGCFRNRNERLYWNQYTEFQKQLVVNFCEKRRLKVIQAQTQARTQAQNNPPQYQPVTQSQPELPFDDTNPQGELF